MVGLAAAGAIGRGLGWRIHGAFLMVLNDHIHVGRSWLGTKIEDECPCEKAPCGLAMPTKGVICDEHNPENPAAARTMRQMHWDSECTAAGA